MLRSREPISPREVRNTWLVSLFAERRQYRLSGCAAVATIVSQTKYDKERLRQFVL